MKNVENARERKANNAKKNNNYSSGKVKLKVEEIHGKGMNFLGLSFDI
ncbi:hypothetical protein [Helicovermis profundi]|uniref:Uncharacterized protein n=1 Tax=Helicovermis profundi TaxID=3065157 RepID=A0AAU9EGU2_9FIRM|nr:hypothetical protein HLPR_09990 [Clostridia bacterium S502]